MQATTTTTTAAIPDRAATRSTNLMDASRQWATRPDDQRFGSIAEMRAHYADVHRRAAVSTVDARTLRFEDRGDEIVVIGETERPARMTNWAFGQMARSAGAPADYLRSLPASIGAQALQASHRKTRDDDGERERQLLFHRHDDGTMLLRGATSDKYVRVWNDDVLARVERLQEFGWRVPPARPVRDGQRGTRVATAEDVIDFGQAGGGINIAVGDEIAPAGLYGSAHDVFAFLVNPAARVEDGSEGGLSRGVFIRNSDVGASSWTITTFLLRNVCGNHIVWGAQDLAEISFRHVGQIGAKWGEAVREVAAYAETSARDDEQRIRAAQALRLGDGKDDVVDALFAKKVATRSQLEDAFDSTDAFGGIDGDPRTAWGMAQGLTRVAQMVTHADKRNAIDRAAGKVLRFAF